MTSTIQPSSSPASDLSPPSGGSSFEPRTSLSPTPEPPRARSSTSSFNGASVNNGIASTHGKRKPSRRANTAERRATHNAVERARRDTLNGRFLDLAKYLPNLSKARRPSKSAIVNSSIAHVHASRRHRALASRELHMLKLEAEHLRRELNEWHDRACIPRVEEPVRSESFSMVLHEELEVIPVMTSGTLEDEEDDDNGPHDNDIRSLQGSHDYAPIPSGGALGIEEHQGMLMNSVVTGRPFPPAMSANRNFPLYNQQRPSFSHQPHSYPAFTSSHGPSPEGYVGPPVADTSYYGVTSEKYPNPPIQQYFDNLSFARRRAEANGRIRSNSIASMTSSGSASPPLYPYPHTQPQFEVGWARSQQHHPASVGKSGGIGNGPLLGMM